MRLGLSSYTFGWAVGVAGFVPAKPLDAHALVELTSGLGVGVVQLADNVPLDLISDSQRSDLRQLADDREVEIEVGMRGLTLERTKRYIEIAQSMKSPILRVVIDDTDYEPHFDDLKRLCRELAPELKSNNVCLAIENHDRFRCGVLAKLIREVDSDHVQICLDTANSLGAGEGIGEALDALAPYVVNLHIKDFQISRVESKMGFLVEGRPAGAGQLDIADLVHEVASYNRCESAILELWTPFEKSLPVTIEKERTWAEQSIRYLQTLISE